MVVFRIARKEYIQDLSGRGAELFGGRWNEKGIPALYTSSSLSLAALEILKKFGAEPSAAAGFSLGEWSAICVSGVLSFEETAYAVPYAV